MHIPLSTLISLQVGLEPRGGSKFVGLCPFHEEQTPSFVVDDIKGTFHCFGCGADGDAQVFTLAMATK